jgi:ABC-type glycerol-3-phosphate transport system permease component
MKSLRTLLIYLLLIGGSLVFVWPFLWMIATSAKLDRELFSDTMRLWPERPIPRLQSPYVDDRLFDDVHGPRLEETLAIIEKDLAARVYSWPSDVDRKLLLQQAARGIYAKLLSVLPAPVLEAAGGRAGKQNQAGDIAAVHRRSRRPAAARLLHRRFSGGLLRTTGRSPRAGRSCGNRMATWRRRNRGPDPGGQP